MNQAFAMKLQSNESSDIIARKVIDEYFRNDELSSEEKNMFITSISHTLGD
jgi:hypothetical protein